MQLANNKVRVFRALKWYQWPLIPFALPAAMVVGIPLLVLAALSIPYYKVFPDHHPHIVDMGGTPRQRQLIESWRAKYRELGIVGRIGVALSGRRRSHRVVVRALSLKDSDGRIP